MSNVIQFPRRLKTLGEIQTTESEIVADINCEYHHPISDEQSSLDALVDSYMCDLYKELQMSNTIDVTQPRFRQEFATLQEYTKKILARHLNESE